MSRIDDLELDLARLRARDTQRAVSAEALVARNAAPAVAYAAPNAAAADAVALLDAATARTVALNDAAIRDDAIDVAARAVSVARDHHDTLVTTYLYLRLSMIGTVVAIFVAILFSMMFVEWEWLRSISHYYYGPARIVFVGALTAASLALLALSGSGAERAWLDLAALFAPLIAIVPTPTKYGEVGKFDPGCASSDDCIPEDVLPYVTVGFWVWVAIAAVVIFIAAIRAWLRYRDRGSLEVSFWVPIAAGAVIVLTYAFIFRIFNNFFLAWAHVVSASTFFVIITIVALIEARRAKVAPLDGGSGFVARLMRELRWIPRTLIHPIGTVAWLMALNLLAATAVLGGWIRPEDLGITNGVFIVEAIGLTLFAIFWGIETWRKRDDPDA